MMNSAMSVYRRQVTIRTICRRIDYQGKYAWLITATEVPILGSKVSGTSRIRFKMFSVKRGATGFMRLQLQDSRKVKIEPNTVLVAQPVMRGRRRDLLIFMHPTMSKAQQWSRANDDRLSPEETAVVAGDEDAFDPDTMTIAHAICHYRGLVDLRGNPTEKGTKLIRKW